MFIPLLEITAQLMNSFNSTGDCLQASRALFQLTECGQIGTVTSQNPPNLEPFK